MTTNPPRVDPALISALRADLRTSRFTVAGVLDLLGPMAAARLPMMLAADRGLARLQGRPEPQVTGAERKAVRARFLAGLPATLAGRLRRLAGRRA